MFGEKYLHDINEDKNIFSIYNLTTPELDNKHLDVINVRFGPKKYVWEPCSYENFELKKRLQTIQSVVLVKKLLTHV